MRTALSLLVLLTAALLTSAFAPSSAKADDAVYPWCAYYGGDEGTATCGFVSLQQCMETISGNGGYCDRSPEAPVASAASERRLVRVR
ncbi:MAG TPA: DUF3551 domain-containing protein [Xanthobacteraceae bacterium]|nr:DUF3551 domain-containing protein [Xanthobacteraceae bacterium]